MPEQPSYSAWPAYESSQEQPCEICNKWADNCECPECPKCSSQGDPKCYKEHGLVNPKGQLIRNIKELCEHNGAHLEEHTDKDCEARISRSLFKYTECGCSFYWEPPMNESYGHISVAGYCEGSDGYIEPRVLNFPFWSEDYDKAVEEADADGVAEWNETHGCPLCFRWEGLSEEKIKQVEEADEEIEGFDWEPRPIDKSCPSCKGDGLII